MDGAFKTYTSLRCNLTQADLDFLIFGHQNKTDPTLCNLPIKNLKPPFDTRILHSKKQLPALAVKPQSISSKIHQQLGGVCTKARRQCTGTGRFCDDFGRKLEVLSALVTKQRFAATDGSKNPRRAMEGSSGDARVTLPQPRSRALRTSYFRTTEPNKTCRFRRTSQGSATS